MTNKKCNDNCSCSNVDSKITATDCGVKPAYKPAGEKEALGYGFYSNVLKKPFERLDDLKKAEEVYFAEQKAKENKVIQKKADAQKVEEAFKALNQARKTFKEELTQLTTEYSEALTELKKAFELGKKDIHNTLAEAENAYTIALRIFTEKYPEGYHLTLKDGDFETTISGSNSLKSAADFDKLSFNSADIFEMIFGLN